MTNIFISYRREDSADVSGRIYDQLIMRFGKNHVFFDVDTIPKGMDFKLFIENTIRECDIMILVIGRQWLTLSNQAGRRLDAPDDFVRNEIELALSHHVPIIPVLVQNAPMPVVNQLPLTISSLATLNAATVRANPDFPYDIEQLIKAINDLVQQTHMRDIMNDSVMDLANEIRDYLSLAGWKVISEPAVAYPGKAKFIVERASGIMLQRVLVHCTSDEASYTEVQNLLQATRESDILNGWLIAESRVDPVTQEKFANNTTVKILSLKDFLEELSPFKKYLSWFQAEYANRSISENYIELACTKPTFDEFGREIGQARYDSLSNYIDRWLGDRSKSHISILGDFGTGKTWFCWFYAQQQMTRYLKQPSHERLPLVIALRNYVGVSGTEHLFSEFFKRFEIDPLKYEIFERLNRQGKFLILFDGFDEMVRANIPSIITENFEMLALIATQNSKVILTCRTPYFHNNVEEQTIFFHEKRTRIDIRLHPRFDIIYINEFNSDQIQKALQKRRGRSWQQYWNQISETYDLPDLVHRPVMLDMVIETLPSLAPLHHITVVDLYRSYTESWIKQIGEERSFLDSNARKDLMRAFAWQMYNSGQLEIHFSDLPEILQKNYGLTNDINLSHYEHDIRAQSYLIRNSAGYYFFAHKSFMEFFVAEKLCADIAANHYISFGERPFPSEVTDFLVEMDFDPKILLHWLQQARANPDLKYLGGNILTLLKRKGHDIRSQDFSHLQIYNADLSGAHLQDCSFYGSTLDAVNLTDANLVNTNFKGAHVNNLILGVRSAAKCVSWSPEGNYIATNRGDNTIILFDAHSFQAHALLHGHQDSITSIRFSSDSKLIASGSFDKTAIVWRLTNPETPIILRGHTSTVYDICFNQNGRYLVTSSNDKHIKIWDIESAQAMLTLEGHQSTVYSVCFAPNDNYIVSGSFDNSVGLWSVKYEKNEFKVTQFQQLLGHNNLVNGICFSPDGRFIASSSNDTSICIWEVETGQRINILKGHTGAVWSVSYSPDGKYLASGSTDTKIIIWDLTASQIFTVLHGHKSEVWHVCFSPDGKYLVSSSFDNTIRVWDWEVSKNPCIKKIVMIEDKNQKINCNGMNITDLSGLSDLQRRFLIHKGAVEEKSGQTPGAEIQEPHGEVAAQKGPIGSRLKHKWKEFARYLKKR